MSVKRKLTEWHAAGLLSAEDAAGILQYEEQRQRQRPYLLYALGGLGALAVATGVLALVASNWDAIPPAVKLGADLLLVAALSAGLVRADAKHASWVRETLILLQYGVVLASIGLVSQVYHLGGEPYQALLVWSALTFFLMSRGRSAVLAGIWILGLKVTFGAVLEKLEDTRALGLEEELVAGLAYLVPLTCLGLAGSERLARARPHLAGALRSFGWLELALAGSLGPLAFYSDDAADHPGQLLVAFVLAALATGVLIARAGPKGERATPARRAVQAVLVAVLLASFLPFLLPHEEWPAAAALAFIAFWATVGWAGYTLRQLPVLNVATAMIGLRILIAYFEVFGSLLSTGLGLITGGLLTLLFTWLWVRKSKDFKRQFGADRAPPVQPGDAGVQGGTQDRSSEASDGS
jgi:hypothetical protein